MPLRYMYKKLCKGGSIYIEECVAYIFFLYMAAVPVSFFSLLLLSGSIHMCANQRSKRKKKNVVSQNIFLNLLFFAKARHFDWWIVEEELWPSLQGKQQLQIQRHHTGNFL